MNEQLNKQINLNDFEQHASELEKRIKNLDQWSHEFEIKIDNFLLSINAVAI